MEQLPDRAQLATKEDMGILKGDLEILKQDVGILKKDMASLETRLRADFERFDRRLDGYVRTFIVTPVTSIFGAVGLFLGISQLL